MLKLPIFVPPPPFEGGPGGGDGFALGCAFKFCANPLAPAPRVENPAAPLVGEPPTPPAVLVGIGPVRGDTN